MIDNPNMMRAVIGVMVRKGIAGELEHVDWDAILVADMDQEVIERWRQIVAGFFARHSKEQLGRWSLDMGWGLSVIYEPEEVRENPHLGERGLFVEVSEPATGNAARLPGPLFLHGAGGPAPGRTLQAPRPAGDIKGWAP